jgi:hypothetical protein
LTISPTLNRGGRAFDVDDGDDIVGIKFGIDEKKKKKDEEIVFIFRNRYLKLFRKIATNPTKQIILQRVGIKATRCRKCTIYFKFYVKNKGKTQAKPGTFIAARSS